MFRRPAYQKWLNENKHQKWTSHFSENPNQVCVSLISLLISTYVLYVNWHLRVMLKRGRKNNNHSGTESGTEWKQNLSVTLWQEHIFCKLSRCNIWQYRLREETVSTTTGHKEEQEKLFQHGKDRWRQEEEDAPYNARAQGLELLMTDIDHWWALSAAYECMRMMNSLCSAF